MASRETRQFGTGATRDSDTNKLDYEGFISPLVWNRFAEYMHKCRLRNIPVGETVRASDNWQKGIPLDQYVKSGLRHAMEWWLMHRGYVAKDEKGNVLDLEEVLCAILFNVQGYLFELLERTNGSTLRVRQERKMPGLPGGSSKYSQVETVPDVPQSMASPTRETITNQPGSIESNWNGKERRGLAESSTGPSACDCGDIVGGCESVGSPSFFNQRRSEQSIW